MAHKSEIFDTLPDQEVFNNVEADGELKIE